MIRGKGTAGQQIIVSPKPEVVEGEITLTQESKPRQKETSNFYGVFTKTNPFTMKFVIYNDRDMTDIAREEVIKGSVREQIALVKKRVEEVSPASYPQEALQEVLLNAVAHRDYKLKGATLINITDEEVAILSLGGLKGGLFVDDIEAGICLTPNEELANELKKQGLISLCGSGIRRVKALYKEYRLSPRFYATQNVFVAILPSTKTLEKKKKEGTLTLSQKQEEAICAFLLEHGTATEEDLQKLLNTRRTRTYLITKAMTDGGVLAKVGRGKEKKYCLAKK